MWREPLLTDSSKRAQTLLRRVFYCASAQAAFWSNIDIGGSPRKRDSGVVGCLRLNLQENNMSAFNVDTNNPNWPSKTGNPSGGGRGNNTPTRGK